MKMESICLPVGQTRIVKSISEICENAAVYRTGRLPPPSFVINLEEGEGQTTWTKYIAEMYEAAGILPLRNPDKYLEYTLDGSMSQLKEVLSDISSGAVYTNRYEGVISMDIGGLAPHVNETQTDAFIKGVDELSGSAAFVFYIPAVPSKNILNLVGRLNRIIPDLMLLNADRYSGTELAVIVRRRIENAGVMLEDTDITAQLLTDIISANGIRSVRDTDHLYKYLLLNTDYEVYPPLLRDCAIQNYVYISDKNNEVNNER